MDYPLHQHYTDRHQENTTSSNNYRSYQVFNERPALMYDNMEERSSNMLLTRPSQDPWNQQLHSYDNVQHTQIPTMPHSERGIAGFVSKLYQCLQSVENNQRYARWCQHDGKDMFVIDCIPEFTEFVLPRLFKHCKFPSFVRQLNIYGFQRDTDARKSKDTKDKESCRWYHPNFRPGRRDLFHLIRRKATRYSRKKRVKASVEEDPETILPLGSGDESEIDDDSQNMILLVNNDDQERRLSSASSVTQSMQPIDYTSAPSQLQLGFHEPETNTTSPIVHLDTDNADMTLYHHQEPLMHDHKEQEFQRMRRDLNLAQIRNNEYKARIQQLEAALDHYVKQSTIQQPGGYMSTVCTTIPNTLNETYLHSPRLVTNHRPMFEMQKTPRPNYNNFYFHQQEVKQEQDTWFQHRDSLSAAIDSTNGMPTAEGNTTTDVVKERLKTASPLTTNNRNDTTNKLDLNGHMNFNNYM